jgi:hypothetical protein
MQLKHSLAVMTTFMSFAARNRDEGMRKRTLDFAIKARDEAESQQFNDLLWQFDEVIDNNLEKYEDEHPLQL